MSRKAGRATRQNSKFRSRAERLAEQRGRTASFAAEQKGWQSNAAQNNGFAAEQKGRQSSGAQNNGFAAE